MGIPASPESVSENPAGGPAQPEGGPTPPRMQHFRRTCRVLRLRGVRAVLALFESFVARLIGSIGCALTAPGADANRYVEDTSHDISAVYAR